MESRLLDIEVVLHEKVFQLLMIISLYRTTQLLSIQSISRASCIPSHYHFYTSINRAYTTDNDMRLHQSINTRTKRKKFQHERAQDKHKRSSRRQV